MNIECLVVEMPPDDRLQMAKLEPPGGNREYSSNRSGQLNNNDAGNERGVLRSLTLLSSKSTLYLSKINFSASNLRQLNC